MFEVILEKQTPVVAEINDVENWIKENQPLITLFLDYAKTRNDAVGLAANQLSFNGDRCMYRMFASRAVGHGLGKWKVYINPKITDRHGRLIESTEGCLTWPKNKVLAERCEAVSVSYYNRDGSEFGGKIVDYEAKVFQHEQDHLDGVEEVIVERDYRTVKAEKIGRNEPCPCGSKKKYKKCCLNK